MKDDMEKVFESKVSKKVQRLEDIKSEVSGARLESFVLVEVRFNIFVYRRSSRGKNEKWRAS